jgi:hypothetical protein
MALHRPCWVLEKSHGILLHLILCVARRASCGEDPSKRLSSKQKNAHARQMPSCLKLLARSGDHASGEDWREKIEIHLIVAYALCSLDFERSFY